MASSPSIIASLTAYTRKDLINSSDSLGISDLRVMSVFEALTRDFLSNSATVDLVKNGEIINRSL